MSPKVHLWRKNDKYEFWFENANLKSRFHQSDGDEKDEEIFDRFLSVRSWQQLDRDPKLSLRRARTSNQQSAYSLPTLAKSSRLKQDPVGKESLKKVEV